MRNHNPRRLLSMCLSLSILVVLTLALFEATAARAEEPIRFVMHRVGTFRSEACGVGDFTGDGKLDIVGGEFLYVAPDWRARRIRELGGSVDEQGKGYRWDFANMPMDVDGDGLLDVVACDWFGKCLDWYRNPGDADGLWKRTVIDVSTNYETAALVDIDGDGEAREILPAVQPTIWFRREPTDADPSRMVKHVISEKRITFGGGVGDVNGDGRPDVIRPGAWYEAPADPVEGQWTEHPIALGGKEPGQADHTPQILVFDVDADGLADLITSSAHKHGIFWYRQIRNGDSITFERHTIDDTWTQAHSLTLADLDADGTLELVAGKRFLAHNGGDPGSSDPLGIYYYRLHRTTSGDDATTPTWTRHIVSLDEGIGSGLDLPVVDLDGDGDLDLVVTGKWGGPVWFENTNPRLKQGTEQ